MKLREYRLNKGLTQKEMAEAIGCTLVTYQRYEAGTREPSITILKTISVILSVSIDALVENIGDSDPVDIRIESAARNAEPEAKKYALELLLNHQKSLD